RVVERIERDAEGGGVGQRLDAELHQVRRVAGVARGGGIGIGAVGQGEDRAVGGRRSAAGQAGAERQHQRIGRVLHLPRAVVVVEEVLVQELAGAVGAGAGDQDRRRLPHAAVLQLRRVGQRLVQQIRAGPRRGPAVERVIERGRRRGAVAAAASAAGVAGNRLAAAAAAERLGRRDGGGR